MIKERGWLAQRPNDWASGVLMQPLAQLCSMMLCVVMMRCNATCSTCWRCWKLKFSLFFLYTRHRFGSSQGEKIVNISLSRWERTCSNPSRRLCMQQQSSWSFFTSRRSENEFSISVFNFLFFFTLLTANALNRTGRLPFMLLAWLLLSLHFNTFSFQYTQQQFFLVTFHLCCRVGDDAEEIVSSRKKRIDEWKFFLHWDRKTSLIFNIRDFDQFLIDFHLFCSLKTLLFSSSKNTINSVDIRIFSCAPPDPTHSAQLIPIDVRLPRRD